MEETLKLGELDRVATTTSRVNTHETLFSSCFVPDHTAEDRPQPLCQGVSGGRSWEECQKVRRRGAGEGAEGEGEGGEAE